MKRSLALFLVLMLMLPTALADGMPTPEEILNRTVTLDDIIEKGPDRLTEEKITFRVFAGSSVKSQVRDNMDENLMTQWYESKTNVHIDWEVPPTNEITTKLNLSLASNDYPDMYYGVSMNTAQTLLYAEQGVLIPLNPYLEEYAPDYYRALQEDPDLAAAMTAPDGNIYAFPRTDEGMYLKTYGKLWAYKPWLEKLGMDVPTTPEEFKAYLIAVRDNDLNGNGDPTDEIPFVAASGDYSRNYNPLSYLMTPFQKFPYHSRLDIKDGVVYAPFTTEGWKEGLR